jgi:hypothetical protein
MSSISTAHGRLHNGREFVGRVTRRTNYGLVLDTGLEVAMAEVRAITAALAKPPSAISVTGGLRRARTPSANPDLAVAA